MVASNNNHRNNSIHSSLSLLTRPDKHRKGCNMSHRVLYVIWPLENQAIFDEEINILCKFVKEVKYKRKRYQNSK